MFRTELTPIPFYQKISIDSPILLMGSCFTTHMGEKLQAYKFNLLTNPSGVIYNPISLFKCIHLSQESEDHIEEGILENQGIFRHWDFHSDVSHPNKNELIKSIQQTLTETGNFLKKADWIIFTFGTSYVFRHKNTNRIVANCHKVPAKEFERSMLTIEDIRKGFLKIHRIIKKLNPDTKIMLTVSPVRHLRDSLEMNNVSKSILRVGCHELQSEADGIYYFPAYEIVMDDLRDYRFYNADMLHPNQQAIEYIWDKFKKTCIDAETNEFIIQWEKILRALNHKPFYPGTNEHKTFILKTIEEVDRFSNVVDVRHELEVLKNQL